MRRNQTLEKSLFLCALLLYLMATTLQFTMYTQVGMVSKVLSMARYLSFALAGVKIVWDFLHLCQNKQGGWDITGETVSCGVKYALLAGLVLAVSWTSGDHTLLFVFALLLASKGVDVERICATAVPVQVGLYVLVLLSATAGMIPDLLFVREDSTVRHALGFTYPTVAMTYFYFALVAWMWRSRRGVSPSTGGWMLAVNYLLFLLTDARNGFFMATAVILVEIGLGQRSKWGNLAHRMGKKRWVRRICRVIGHGYDYCGVYLSLILLVMCLLYPNGPMETLNRLLSDRIRLTVQGVANYGIHLLGNDIQWVGYGGLTDWSTLGSSYNFVDSSYAAMLLNYGLLLSVGVLVLLVLAGKRLRRRGNWNQCFLYLSVLVYCFIEPSLLELHLNLILFTAAPFLYHIPMPRRRER